MPRRPGIGLSIRQRRIRYGARRGTFLLLVLAAVAALAGVDLLGLFGRAPLNDIATFNGKEFLVADVVDGDTIDVACPQGPRGRVRVRLWGIDTPETVKPDTPVQHFGPEASGFVHQLLRGKTVKLQLEMQETRDKYGRLLAYVVLDDGRMLNRILVAEGYAYADPRYDHSCKQEFLRLQREAMRAGLGLWANETEADLPYYWCGQLKLPKRVGTSSAAAPSLQ